MRHQPARTFRNPQPHEENHQREAGADQESQSPAKFGIDHRRIEQHQRAERTNRCADPEAAIDDEVAPATHARRDQLLDGGVDRGIFTADAGAGDKPKECKTDNVPGPGGRRRRDQIDRQRNEKQFLAAEPVGEPAKADGAQHGAGEIGAAREPNIGVGKVQARALLERARQRAGQRDFQPVQNPGDTERGDHQGVKAPPRQPVEPRRNVGFYDVAVSRHRRPRHVPPHANASGAAAFGKCCRENVTSEPIRRAGLSTDSGIGPTQIGVD